MSSIRNLKCIATGGDGRVTYRIDLEVNNNFGFMLSLHPEEVASMAPGQLKRRLAQQVAYQLSSMLLADVEAALR